MSERNQSKHSDNVNSAGSDHAREVKQVTERLFSAAQTSPSEHKDRIHDSRQALAQTEDFTKTIPLNKDGRVDHSKLTDADYENMRKQLEANTKPGGAVDQASQRIAQLTKAHEQALINWKTFG